MEHAYWGGMFQLCLGCLDADLFPPHLPVFYLCCRKRCVRLWPQLSLYSIISHLLSNLLQCRFRGSSKDNRPPRLQLLSSQDRSSSPSLSKGRWAVSSVQGLCSSVEPVNPSTRPCVMYCSMLFSLLRTVNGNIEMCLLVMTRCSDTLVTGSSRSWVPFMVI